MYPSVKNRFIDFNAPFEGRVKYMYLDIKGLVTVGVGNLVDPVGAATSLPFTFKNKPGAAKAGQAASSTEIAAEWKKLKDDQSLAKKGHRHCEPITDLELTDAAIDALIERRLTQNETFLKKHFKDFDTWPADAQMGVLSMAWAAGPGFYNTFKNFSAACLALDFDKAATECRLSETGNPGVIPRNRADKLLFENAAAVLAGEADGFYQKQVLYYPTVCLKPIVVTG